MTLKNVGMNVIAFLLLAYSFPILIVISCFQLFGIELAEKRYSYHKKDIVYQPVSELSQKVVYPAAIISSVIYLGIWFLI